MTRIPTKTGLVYSDVKDKTKVTLPGADRHAVDGSGYGTSKSLDLQVLDWSTSYQFVAATAHGLVAGDIGKPLSGTAILNDTTSTHWPTGILMAVPTVDALMVALPGAHVRLPLTLLEFGSSWSFSTHGRFTWWDFSTTQHRAARQSDAVRGMCSTLYILSIGPTTFDAIVRPMVSQLRLIPEKTLSTGDVTSKFTNVLPANAAADAWITVGGVPVSVEDGTFTSSNGNLSWTGLGLETTATAGMRVMGFWEPKQ